MARVASVTPSGRVRALAFDTDAGAVTMTGNDMRFALRGVGGELLNSTYFSLEPTVGREGRLTGSPVIGGAHGARDPRPGEGRPRDQRPVETRSRAVRARSRTT